MHSHEESKKADGAIPNCPISQESVLDLTDPVLAPDGHIYEKSELITWVSSHAHSPINRQLRMESKAINHNNIGLKDILKLLKQARTDNIKLKSEVTAARKYLNENVLLQLQEGEELLTHQLLTDINISFSKTELRSILIKLITKKKYDLANLLLAKEVDLNYQEEKTGNGFVHLSMQDGQSDFVKKLCEKNVNLQQENKQGQSALILAIKLNLPELIHYFVQEKLRAFNLNQIGEALYLLIIKNLTPEIDLLLNSITVVELKLLSNTALAALTKSALEEKSEHCNEGIILKLLGKGMTAQSIFEYAIHHQSYLVIEYLLNNQFKNLDVITKESAFLLLERNHIKINLQIAKLSEIEGITIELQRNTAMRMIRYLFNNAERTDEVRQYVNYLKEHSLSLHYLCHRQGKVTFSIHRHSWEGRPVSATFVRIIHDAKNQILSLCKKSNYVPNENDRTFLASRLSNWKKVDSDFIKQYDRILQEKQHEIKKHRTAARQP